MRGGRSDGYIGGDAKVSVRHLEVLKPTREAHKATSSGSMTRLPCACVKTPLCNDYRQFRWSSGAHQRIFVASVIVWRPLTGLWQWGERYRKFVMEKGRLWAEWIQNGLIMMMTGIDIEGRWREGLKIEVKIESKFLDSYQVFLEIQQ